MKFTVKRSEWFRGKEVWRTDGRGGAKNCESVLLNEYGKKCCLGFLALERGYTESEIRFVPTPEELYDSLNSGKSKIESLPQFLLKKDPLDERLKNSHACIEIIKINDDMDICEEEREIKLKEHFRRNGVEIEFVD